MNKKDLKKLLVCGFAAGCLSVSQSSMAEEEKTHEDLLATETEKTHEEIFAAGCKGGCGSKSNPKNNRAMTQEEEEQQNQIQGQGHGHGCAGRAQPRPYQA